MRLRLARDWIGWLVFLLFCLFVCLFFLASACGYVLGVELVAELAGAAQEVDDVHLDDVPHFAAAPRFVVVLQRHQALPKQNNKKKTRNNFTNQKKNKQTKLKREATEFLLGDGLDRRLFDVLAALQRPFVCRSLRDCF